MVNRWFKFYGTEYLSDPKILMLSASERSCWITLMCYASSSKNGIITHLGEKSLMTQAGVTMEDGEWNRTVGVLAKLEALDLIINKDGVITLKGWKKRQEMYLTSAERVQRHREKKRSADVTQMKRNANARIDKNRLEKKREYLSRVPKTDIDEWTARFVITEKDIRSVAENLRLYCESKGRVYKNYRSFLLNAIKRDFKERRQDGEPPGKYAHI